MMNKLSGAIVTGSIALGLTCGLAPHAYSKDKAAKITGQTITATGCLTQDPKEKNEYLITGEDGKTWGLKSNAVKLSEHLNHKVTVTGKVTKGGHESEAGDVNVSDLKMVSTTCK
jgi:hypothetical protein